MELTELLVIDPESLSVAQAKVVADEVIGALAQGVSASDQDVLRPLLIAAQEMMAGRKVGESVRPGTRERVRSLIAEAQERGDELTARYLAEGMAAQDLAEADNSAAEALNAVNQYIADDIAAQEAIQRKELERLVEIRTQELLFALGWEITEEEARRRATTEFKENT